MWLFLFLQSKCTTTAYKDLQSREDTRNAAWQRDGWDEIVYYTGQRLCNWWLLGQYWHNDAASIAWWHEMKRCYTELVLKGHLWSKYLKENRGVCAQCTALQAYMGWLPRLARDQGQFVFTPQTNHTTVHCERTMATSSGGSRPGCFDPGASIVLYTSPKNYTDV